MAKAGIKSSRINLHTQSIDFESVPNEYENYAEAETSYLKIATKEHRKQYAQYFTPISIAQLMCNWISEINPSTILDPSVGVGVFISTLLDMKLEAKISANDIDKNILYFAKGIPGAKQVNFVQKDFLLDECDSTYDAIVANPPYLRHHDFHYEEDIFSLIGKRNSVAIPRTMNIYGLFVLEICRRLNVGGRAAIILPSEWINSNFGKPLKEVLLNAGLIKTILLFSHEISQFDDALTTTCILFIEKSNSSQVGDVNTIYLTSPLKTQNIGDLIERGNSKSSELNVNKYSSKVLLNEKKWDHLIRSSVASDQSDSIQLKSFATTKRGIATGANDYFLLSVERAKELSIRDINLTPCIGKSSDVKGLIFNQDDLDDLIEEGANTHLLTLRSNINEQEALYVKLGEEMGLPLRHLLSVRKVWYHMEKRQPAPILAAVQGRGNLRFVRNCSNAINLTAFHGIYPIDQRPVYLDALTVYLNSQTVQDASKREQRMYGGGLIKVQPDDLLDMRVPDLKNLSEDRLTEIANYLPTMDRLYRDKQKLEDCHTCELRLLLRSMVCEFDSSKVDERQLRQVDLFAS